jgi:hypothetical protein
MFCIIVWAVLYVQKSSQVQRNNILYYGQSSKNIFKKHNFNIDTGFKTATDMLSKEILEISIVKRRVTFQLDSSPECSLFPMNKVCNKHFDNTVTIYL